MEQARLFLAIALSFLVLLVWNFFFTDNEIVKEPVKKSESSALNKEESVKKTEPQMAAADKAPLSSENGSLPEKDISPFTGVFRTITVNSHLYSVKISEKGAVFKSFVLKDYREKANADSPLKQMIPENISMGSICTEFAANTLPGLKDAVFSADIDSDTLDVSHQPGDIAFTWESPDGIIFEKKFHFSSSTYLIGLSITVKNGSSRVIQDSLVVSLTNQIPVTADSYSFEGPSGYINNRLEQIKFKKIKDQNTYPGNLKWIAVESRYFISGLVIKEPVESGMRPLLVSDKILMNQYIHPVTTIQPGKEQRFEFELFSGPKSLKILSSLNNKLDKAIDFGWFDFIGKPCLWMLNFIHGFIPNYGFAIIILTILIKLILWPLGNKGYQSMNEMKKLQPLMTEIREKYKDDKRRMNEEVMGLYRTYKVNPMGGCLPMILQIPVFFAFYRMLYEAIELRHAPFIGWVDDLSAPDRLFHFNFTVPFMQPPYGIPVLTIVMGATMFLQQKMSPPPGDPAQAKMMMFMPIIFTVIFINFSSGLVLYWLISNIISIAQQYYILKKNP